MPAGEPMVIEVPFVSIDKVVTGSLLIEIGSRPHGQGHRSNRICNKLVTASYAESPGNRVLSSTDIL